MVMSTTASHSPLNISETVRETWFQRTTNRKQVVTPIRLERNISKTAGDAI